MLALILAALLSTAATPPDVVRLKDGGFMRGTISELVPGQYVVITLPNGEARRVEMDKVEYAGPDQNTGSSESDEPGGPRTAAPRTKPETRGLRLHLTSPDQGARFYLPVSTRIGRTQGNALEGDRKVRINEFRELCKAPCDVTLDPGTYALAMTVDDDDDPIRADTEIELVKPMSVEGEYTSYVGVRAAGYVISLAGLIAGVVLVVNPPGDDDTLGAKTVLPGVLTGLISGLVGGIMTRVDDDAEIYVLE